LVRDADWQVHGYYTLATGALKPSLLPTKLSRKLPQHPVPAALLARLAIDRRVQGQGLGRVLLLDALARCATFSQQIGIALVEVQAIDEAARSFYSRFGFQPLEDSDRHLYLSIDLVPRDLEESEES
jgi:GNAT superfamily N-acetyltransferase